MSLRAPCPSCGADVVFKVSTSWVLVCEYCRHVVGRGDKALEDYGKSADLTDSASPLELGLEGTYAGEAFVITGRLQIEHGKGGSWDEWYALFSDGRWGWLAEAQGKLYLTFAHPDPPRAHIPFASLAPGQTVELPDGARLVVSEVGVGTYRAGEGEIPFRVRPGDRYEYADLQGADARFATLDFSDEPPKLYLGREVTLADLGLAGRAPVERPGQKIKAVSVNCPSCDGALELRAPEAQRVGCPYCGALSDVSEGKLALLKTLDKSGHDFRPDLELGARGTIRGHEYTVIGFLVRYVTFDGVRYFWNEYLLYAPAIGYRWLVHSDGHWSFVEPVSLADVQENMRGVFYKGKKFRLFQAAKAKVAWVVGEFTWKVKQGETVAADDLIAPPLILSKEADKDEINWSLGHFVPAADVEKGFGLAKGSLGRTDKVAPNQPYPHGAVLKIFPALALLALIVSIGSMACHRRTAALTDTVELAALETPQSTRVWFSEPFHLAARRNVSFTGRTGRLDQEWAYFQGDLVNERTGLVVPFSWEMSWYSGVDADGAWSEGSLEAQKVVSAVPEGDYVLRLEAQWGPKVRPLSVEVVVEQSVPRPVYTLALMIALSIIPLGVLVHRYSFEKRRWADSDHSPYATGEDDE